MAQPNNKPGKAMSSRLLTMKFMQRGASSSPSSTPATPAEPSAKRQRMSNGSYNATPSSTPASTPRSDAQLIEQALAAEEQKRSEALEREGAARGETKWYLSVKERAVKQADASPLRIVSAGYSTLDAAKDRSSEDEEDGAARPRVQGRISFGNFNRSARKQQDKDHDSSSASESDGANEDEADDPTSAMIAQARQEASSKFRAGRKAKRKADEAEARQMAEERRRKQVRLNNLSSISGGGGGPISNRTKATPETVCHRCSRKGHMAWECPTRGRGRG